MKVSCEACGLSLESDISPAEALAQEQARDPEVGSVEFLCDVCLTMAIAANPAAKILTSEE